MSYFVYLPVAFSRGVVSRGIDMHYMERGLIPGFSRKNVVFTALLPHCECIGYMLPKTMWKSLEIYVL